MKNLVHTLLLIIFIFNFHFAQSSSEIKKLMMKENSISVDIYNYGSFSKPGALADIEDFVWNGMGYMYEFGLVIGAKVKGNNGDSIKIISDSFVYSNDGDYDPSGTLKWGWLPVEGFANPSSDEVANSLNKNSWPSSWDEWPGEIGLGNVVALNEAYYKMKDFTNFEYISNYQPFEGNYDIGGLGLSLEVRVYQFGGGLKDALIVKYFVTNESEKNLDNLFFGFRADPHIGGVGDVFDDKAFLVNSSIDSDKILRDQSKNIIHFIDIDNMGRGGRRPGNLAMKILESPENMGLTSFKVTAWGEVDPKDDEIIWEFLENGIDTLSGFYHTSGDNVVTFGTGPFKLEAGATEEIKIAIFLSNNLTDVLNDATYIGLHHNWPTIKSNLGDKGGNEDYVITIQDINTVIRDDYEISWDNTNMPENARVFLEYSYNSGLDWAPIVVEAANTNSWTWNTKQVKDGVNYLLRIVAYNKNTPKDFYYAISDQKFTIDNIDFNAKPELNLLSNWSDTILNNPNVNIVWDIADADNELVNIKIEHSNFHNGPYNEIMSDDFLSGNHSYTWNVTELPNAETNYIRITASDGDKDSILTSNPFGIDIYEGQLSSSHIIIFSGNATPNIQIQTLSNVDLTNDEYSILFHVTEEQKTFDLRNVTRDELLISNYLVNNSISTPLVEGFKVKIKDNGNEIDYSKTRFVSSNSNNINFDIIFPSILGNPKIKVDEDFLFIFNDSDTTDDGKWIFADTMETLLGAVRAPFTIWYVEGNAPNFDIIEPATFVLYEPYESKRNNGQWDWNESIVFQPFGTENATTTFQVDLNNYANSNFSNRDSLYFVTFNEIQDGDEFRFWTDSNLVNVQNEVVPNAVKLYQNYPNPFNPLTRITFEISTSRKVKLAVYNVLGQEIKVLAKQKFEVGHHEVEFNSSSLSSGIYFYRLEAGDFVETKKMILLK